LGREKQQQQHKEKHVELAKQLNKYKVSYATSPEGVALEACPDNSLLNESGVVVDQDLNAFLDAYNRGDFTVWFDDDPRDRRAGVVCCVEHDGDTAWYDTNGDCCWKA
jgi:hypothetical protein